MALAKAGAFTFGRGIRSTMPLNAQLRRMHAWLAPLRETFKRHGDPADAAAMEAYMKGIAPFFGIKATPRRELLKEHIDVHGPAPLDELPAITQAAFAYPERELHQTAVDLLMKQARKLGPADLPLVEELIRTKSWWDTVDALAIHVAGVILKRHPQEIAPWNERWVTSDDLWLNRTAIIFQNRWKEDTDKVLLFANIDRHAARKEFFMRKAIGWALRELGATDPEAVRRFVQARELSPLSVREALCKL